jgi:hypothetical protein
MGFLLFSMCSHRSLLRRKMVTQSWSLFSKVKKTLLGRYLIDRLFLLQELVKDSRSLKALLRKYFLFKFLVDTVIADLMGLFSDFDRTNSREEG